MTSRLSGNFSIRAALEWEPDTGDTNRSVLSLKYNPDDRRIFNANFTYTSPDVLTQVLPGDRDISNQQESELSFIWPLPVRYIFMEVF